MGSGARLRGRWRLLGALGERRGPGEGAGRGLPSGPGDTKGARALLPALGPAAWPAVAGGLLVPQAPSGSASGCVSAGRLSICEARAKCV